MPPEITAGFAVKYEENRKLMKFKDDLGHSVVKMTFKLSDTFLQLISGQVETVNLRFSKLINIKISPAICMSNTDACSPPGLKGDGDNYTYTEFLSHRMPAQQIKSLAQCWNKLTCKSEMES
ncbi:hypothetical protein Anapl_15902 [Anas platyrhynchos]|uniref:Uncharacterized protein n=1 Tax=Anas platyrhynchos TaxID=8839 RepID=R0M6R9_ANAPL|nr:hypothetical protein Anapl_15902 [Anas platyrhynchos]